MVPASRVLVTDALAGSVVLAAAWDLGLIGARAGSGSGLGRAGLLAVGVSEELASRGIPLGLAAPSGKWRSVLTVP
ncbi:hypothetical protein FCG67_12395 [Rhodococcus oryzae]|uniref:Uncharacterized protein n=1 Tax=Rhodococcus oryzae TaxID=2571143 RepID=A0ABY2RJK6_9NOCA|nr:hypothetical protein [Rhodococcus oryzae]TJZ77858.1 hypothetical protein FCG67_12395 [Rhodococcus oryzae]